MRWFMTACLLSSLAGCSADAGPADGDTVDDQVGAIGSTPSFSARVVVPELTWGWWQPQPIEGALALEITGKVGMIGFRDETSTTSPFIGVGTSLYGAYHSYLRIGDDLRVYLEFESHAEPEMYCCSHDPAPEKQPNGTWGTNGDGPSFPDVGRSGFYLVGELVGVTQEDIVHGATLRMENLRLDRGLQLAMQRRIQRGDRLISLEARTEPVPVTTAPTVLTDRAAVDAALQR